MPDMSKCKDCKWFESIPLSPSRLPKRIGSCEKLDDLSLDLEKSSGVYVEYGDEALFVGENFGCIHFGRKTSLEDSIEELGLSELPLRALKSSGIKKVGDLVGRTPRELLVMRKVGEKSLQKIESQLQEYDLVERRGEDGCIHFERRGK